MIENGLKLYKEEGCDFLVALGGGSPIDSMKAIGSLVINGGCISDYMGKVIDVEMPPMVAIPTTAGTGSEATQFTIITDTKKNIKMLLKGKVLMPSLAIIDPQFTMTHRLKSQQPQVSMLYATQWRHTHPEKHRHFPIHLPCQQ